MPRRTFLETRSPSPVARRRQFAAAATEALVIVALVAAIFVVALVAGTGVAEASEPSTLDHRTRTLVGVWLIAFLGYVCFLTAVMLRGFDPRRAPMRAPRRR